MLLVRTCPICGKQITVELVGKQIDMYSKWSAGECLIQDAFPELDCDTREVIKTGICKDCWDKMLDDEEDE